MLIDDFVKGLNEKFSKSDEYSTPSVFSYTTGKKYYKIVQHRVNSETGEVSSAPSSAYAFMDKEGNLYKPANWKTPAKGVRYPAKEVMTTALDDADRFGGFLYVYPSNFYTGK